ncbi:MAG: hypothetical protein N3F05_04850 [Candidatus Diapherotrites archaeon]|nr:hypothetical protein [Candidatus Diapherotrites archaeon]
MPFPKSPEETKKMASVLFAGFAFGCLLFFVELKVIENEMKLFEKISADAYELAYIKNNIERSKVEAQLFELKNILKNKDANAEIECNLQLMQMFYECAVELDKQIMHFYSDFNSKIKSSRSNSEKVKNSLNNFTESLIGLMGTLIGSASMGYPFSCTQDDLTIPKPTDENFLEIIKVADEELKKPENYYLNDCLLTKKEELRKIMLPHTYNPKKPLFDLYDENCDAYISYWLDLRKRYADEKDIGWKKVVLASLLYGNKELFEQTKMKREENKSVK